MMAWLILVTENIIGSSMVENEFANGHAHINGIENFWGLAKTRLAKFKGISKNTFYLHLKECEFRFNYRKHDIYQLLLKSLRRSPLKLS